MKLTKFYLTKNPCYTGGKKLPNGVQGLMLHSIGCPQPSAYKIMEYWNDPNYQAACVHGFVDGNTGDCYQTLPWDRRGWHAGKGDKGSANDTHIGIEMCEPACIKYQPNSGTFTCSDLNEARAVATRTYKSAVELFAYLCDKFDLNPLADGVILSHNEGRQRGITSGHVDPEHLWTQLGMSYTMDGFRKDVHDHLNEDHGLQATELKNLSEAQVVEKVGKLFTEDQKRTGVLACVSMAQFIQESGYGHTELAQNANNCFGMKTTLSGNTWSGSKWDGKSKYTKETKEQNPDGSIITIRADFRKYPNIADSIADHSAYLVGAMNGTKKRYPGISGMKDYTAVAKLIKAGGYATDIQYAERLCNIIEKWNLTRFNVPEVKLPKPPFTVQVKVSDLNYRSEGSMNGKVLGATGKGTFNIVEVNDSGWGKLKSGAGWIYLKNSEYCEISDSGVPFRVKVKISNLNYRTEGSMNGKVLGTTGKGTFTIVEVNSDNWGRLKSGAGWIYLGNSDYCEIVK